ncbi:hypothetical protein DESC_700085 [Desulfosarcina cetonica]|nr:hypothetical protein DESC_700085 [Desulfosarcina cetonica]
MHIPAESVSRSHPPHHVYDLPSDHNVPTQLGPLPIPLGMYSLHGPAFAHVLSCLRDCNWGHHDFSFVVMVTLAL